MQEKGKIIRNDRRKTIIKNNQDHAHVSNLGNWVNGVWPSSPTPILIRVGVGARYGFSSLINIPTPHEYQGGRETLDFKVPLQVG